MPVAAGSGHYLHQFNARLEEIFELLGRAFDHQAADEMRLLGRDAHRTVIGMAGAHSDTADGLHGGVGHGDAVGPQRQRLDKVRGLAQTTGDDQRDVAARASAGMVGTEILSRKMTGAAPVPPPRPSSMM